MTTAIIPKGKIVYCLGKKYTAGMTVDSENVSPEVIAKLNKNSDKSSLNKNENLEEKKMGKKFDIKS